MYVDENIPSNFNKIAEISDNYIILVKESSLNNNSSYEAYVQFFSPSTQVIHLTNYKISTGDDYSYDYHYTNNQYYSYIDYVDVDFTKHTYTLDQTSTDFWDRPDYWSIGCVVFFLMCLVIVIVNLASSLITKGGLFR